jgi:hypothetical protein
MKSCRQRVLRRIVATFAILPAAFIGPSSRSALGDDAKGREQPADEDLDHTIIVGVGGATELELGDGSLHPGANVMVEWDAIENWLELEVGASILTADGGVQVPIALLIKKPFKLTPWAEFMIGVGPEVVQVTGVGKGTYYGGEVALDSCSGPGGATSGYGSSPSTTSCSMMARRVGSAARAGCCPAGEGAPC